MHSYIKQAWWQKNLAFKEKSLDNKVDERLKDDKIRLHYGLIFIKNRL